jgi:hypothetical protein
MRKIHAITLTSEQLQNFPGFFFFKETGTHEAGDYVVVNEEITLVINPTDQADGLPSTVTKISPKQTFFEVKNVQNEKQYKGVKRGFVMVSVKRCKNPLPKLVEDTVEETETEA